MNPASMLLFVGIGCVAGLVSGIVGIGGGIIIVPALIFLAGFSQLSASGTSLAVLLLPIGLAATIQYYRNGHVNIKAAIIIAVTFFICAWIGAAFSKRINPFALRIGFGVITILIGFYIIYSATKMGK